MTTPLDPHAGQSPLVDGVPLDHATYALVLVHGRGGTAEGMLPIARSAGATDAALIAPRAAGGTWYPNRFRDAMASNEPYLTSALAAVQRTVEAVTAGGIPAERIILVGFSQGACLALEYAARNARRLGGIAALAGALIGDEHDARHDAGTFANTPILLACGDADDHIPEPRVRASATMLAAQGAVVDLRIYPGITHTIVADQLDALRTMIDVVRGHALAG
ncbi:MAG: dienelactone hydrolase family protein [Gemmatimonadaceae bacterium]|nr:dienelactone hydrolase family protein [Gemmatimonadaceae bacterium]